MAQIEALRSAGVDCRGLFFTTSVEHETALSEFITLLPVVRSKSKYFRPLDQKRITIKAVQNWLEINGRDTDFIYLRYPGASPSLFRFAIKFGDILVSEHQSKEIIEIRESKREHPFGFKPSVFLSWFNFQLVPLFYEYFWGRLYAKRVRAIVSMTYEMAIHQRKKGCRVVRVIPNGIETSRFKARSVPEIFDHINLLFLKGTSTMASWNGLDRLITSIDAYHADKAPQELSFRLLICGRPMPGEYPDRSYIVHYGYLRGAELEDIFDKAHIAVSTLCSYRRGQEETAILKAREYFARGIPFIYASKDVDFDDSPAVRNNTLNFVNSADRMDMASVVSFALACIADKTHPQTMHAWAMEHLDYNIKMTQLRDLFLDLQRTS
jgi:glycosyltransferase involved in cell wall biosynthesis